MPNAAYTGGFTTDGSPLFAVDGDFTQCDPCGPPVFSYPFKGDSFPGGNSIVLLDGSNTYVEVPLGSGYNVQPFSANQAAIVIEQDFMVAQANYTPLPLNTPYNVPWSIGWTATYVGLGACFLVEESPGQDMGAGVIKVRRKYANLPPTRNEYESFTASFPGLDDEESDPRQPIVRTVQSRVQYDYFVYDAAGLLSIPLFPGDHRLDASTGMSPDGIILDQQRYFPNTAAVANGLELNPNTLTKSSSTSPTNPTLNDYLDWVDNGFEIVAEASSFGPGPWLGNIYCRKTRFVRAQ